MNFLVLGGICFAVKIKTAIVFGELHIFENCVPCSRSSQNLTNRRSVLILIRAKNLYL